MRCRFCRHSYATDPRHMRDIVTVASLAGRGKFTPPRSGKQRVELWISGETLEVGVGLH